MSEGVEARSEDDVLPDAALHNDVVDAASVDTGTIFSWSITFSYPPQQCGPAVEYGSSTTTDTCPGGSSNGILGNPGRSSTLFRELRTALPPLLHPTVSELEATCEERRQLRDQKRLHHWLHGWLLVHVPLSLALLLLGAAHAIIALRY